MEKILKNLKHKIINLLVFKEISKDKISHRFPHLELLLRWIKNFRNSYKPLNVYEKVNKFQQWDKYKRFWWSYRSYRTYKWTTREVNNLIF